MKYSSLSSKFAKSVGVLSLAISSQAFTAGEAHSTNFVDRALSEIGDALSAGTPYADVRYRFETVDQSNFDKDAKASTIRTRVGYKTGEYKNFSGQIELEDVSPIGKEMYNDGGGTASNSAYPTVVDPIGTEVNQAFLTFSGLPGTKASYGRQRVVLGNERFVGDVGWRQNNQTFDGITVVNTSLPDTTAVYGYVYNVNRIFGDGDAGGDLGSSVHLMDLTYAGFSLGKIRAYSYLLDISDSAADSSNTYGGSFSGSKKIHYDGMKALYHLEYARQSDAADNTTNYDADYVHVNAGISFKGLTLKGGYEELGSDNGVAAFRTPLATLHKFNGWADQFLATPNNGLEDAYGLISYKVKSSNNYINGTKLKLVYHDFSADNGSNDYGNEIDFSISKSFSKYYSIGVKYADYNTNNEGSATNDVQKIILSLGFKFN